MKPCLCGCGLPVTKSIYPYRRGHRPTDKPKSRPLCACGCQLPVQRHRATYRRGHCPKTHFLATGQARSSMHYAPVPQKRMCLCGCNQELPSYFSPVRKYIDGHQKNMKYRGGTRRCSCGCGAIVEKPNGRYIDGHKAPPAVRPCACGCGKPLTGTAMKFFLPGHNALAMKAKRLKPKLNTRARRIWLQHRASASAVFLPPHTR